MTDHLIVQTRKLEEICAELDAWRNLKNPATLHANLLRGIPASLTRDQIVHLLGSEDPMVKDAERYQYLRNRSSNDVMTRTGADAGCWIDCETGSPLTLTLLTGDDADAAIDAARKA